MTIWGGGPQCAYNAISNAGNFGNTLESLRASKGFPAWTLPNVTLDSTDKVVLRWHTGRGTLSAL